MTRIWRGFSTALVAVAFSAALRADISGTQTLPANTALNLDTGATAASGGDLLWNGTTLTPQGRAKAYNLGQLGSTGFNTYNASTLQYLVILATTAPITPKIDDVIGLTTNGAHTAKVLVVATGGGSITLQYLTYIAAAPTGPTISAIQNNSSLIASGLPSYGIAPSSLFVIKGTGLAAAGAPVLQDTVAGLPLTLNGASISVTVGGATTHPPIYYTSPAQIAAVLPAATPAGSGTLTVTYNGNTSAPAPIQVVASAPGITTYNGSAVAQDASNYSLISYTNSAQAGETIILWGTGLGADPNDSDTTYSGSPNAIGTPLKIYIGSVQVPASAIAYQGASVYPGVDVIGLTIPAGIPSGCWVPLAVVAGSVVSNVVTLPINPGGGACVDSVEGLNGNQIAPSGGQTLRTGLVDMGQSTTIDKNGQSSVSNFADAAFEKYTGIYTPANAVSPGGCIVNPPPGTVGSLTGLDPGSITLSGPNSLQVTLAHQPVAGAFYSTIGSGVIPQSGGTYTFKGSGGADVGSFTTTFTLTNPLLTWTNPGVAANIDRSSDLTLKWTGGNSGSFVYMSGGMAVVSGGTQIVANFTCVAHAEDGQFTIPSFVLESIPAGTGSLNMQNIILAPLSTTGLDIAIGEASISFGGVATYH